MLCRPSGASTTASVRRSRPTRRFAATASTSAIAATADAASVIWSSRGRSSGSTGRSLTGSHPQSAGSRRPDYGHGMDRTELRALLDAVAGGELSADDAEAALGTAPLRGFDDLGFARLDTHRGVRTGDPEVVYGAGKTVEQVLALLETLGRRSERRPAVATRLSDDMRAAVRTTFPDAVVDDVARCARLGSEPAAVGDVAVISAGTSDEPVAAEAAFVARAFGAGVSRVVDAGVAGIHRLLGEY